MDYSIQDSGFLRTAKWKRKRAMILRRDGYMDQVEKRYGRMIEAEMVHHIFPREEYPEYAMKDWNLVSVSYKTHKSLHNLDGSLTKKGKELLERTRRRAEINGWL